MPTSFIHFYIKHFSNVSVRNSWKYLLRNSAENITSQKILENTTFLVGIHYFQLFLKLPPLFYIRLKRMTILCFR